MKRGGKRILRFGFRSIGNMTPNIPMARVGFRAQVARRAAEELPSYALHDYRAVWEVRDSRAK